MSRVRVSVGSVVAMLCVVTLGAVDSVKGTVTFNTEKAAPSFAMGVWQPARQEISVGLFPKALDAAQQTRALKQGFCCFGFEGAPFAVIDLRPKKGTTTLTPASIEGCHIGFYEFKGSPFDYNTQGEQCGVIAITGVLKAGSAVTVTMKGKGASPAMGSFPARSYAWDVTFEVTLRAQ